MSEQPTPKTDRNALLLANLDDWIDDCIRNSKPIGLTLCDARKRITDQSDRIAELWDAMEILRRERDEALNASEAFSALAWKLEGERNEARKERDKAQEDATNYYAKVGELIEERDNLREAIIATLEENRHLADGDDCTLAKLKSVVPDWE